MQGGNNDDYSLTTICIYHIMQKLAIANLAKGQAIAREVKGLVIALSIAEKYT